MKTLVSLLLLAISGLAHSQTTVLVGPGVLNGDFNDDVSATDQREFPATAPWINIAGPQSTTATRTNLDFNGSRNAQINVADTVVFGQSTGYTIALGDKFNVSYVWRDAFNWNDGVDLIRINLFVTDDDTIGGVRTTIATTDSALSTTNNTYELVDTNGFYTAGASVVGKTLFVDIDTFDVDNSGFARLDNFVLEVETSTIDPLLIVDSGDYAFGDLYHNGLNPSTARTVTFINAGASNPVTLDTISLTGSGIFSITSAPGNGTVIGPGGTFDVEITATGGSGYTDYTGDLVINTTPADQDITLPLTARISSDGDPYRMLDNPCFNDGLLGWIGISEVTTGLNSPNGARVRGDGDPTNATATGNLAQTFDFLGSPDFDLTVSFAIPDFTEWTGFAPDAGFNDRSFHLIIYGDASIDLAGAINDTENAEAIIDLFYFPAGNEDSATEGFYLYNGTTNDFELLAALGTLTPTTPKAENPPAPGPGLNVYQLTIAGRNFGTPSASYDISISDVNATTIFGTEAGLTKFHGRDPQTATATGVMLTTNDSPTGSVTNMGTSGAATEPSWWVDKVQVALPTLLPLALAQSTSPVPLLLCEESSGTTSFSISNVGTGIALNVDSPVFGDPRFTLLSPNLPVDIPVGGSQEFVVNVDASLVTGNTTLLDTLTLTTTDAISASQVSSFEAQTLIGGRKLLVDYDDGLANGIHETSLRNGGFEDGADLDTLLDTPVWVSAFSPEGDTILGTLAADPATGLLHGQATGFSGPGERGQPMQIFSASDWTLQEGDTFTISFSAKEGTGHDGSGPQVIVEVIDANGDLVNDPVNGAPASASRWATPGFNFAGAPPSTYETFSSTTNEIQPGSPWIGNRVQVRFLKGGDRASFINVDDISILAKLKKTVAASLEITAVSFNPATKNVTIRFVDTGAAPYTIESDADLIFGAGTTNYLLDGSEDTVTFPGEIEFTFNDPTATGTFHGWRVTAP